MLRLPLSYNSLPLDSDLLVLWPRRNKGCAWRGMVTDWRTRRLARTPSISIPIGQEARKRPSVPANQHDRKTTGEFRGYPRGIGSTESSRHPVVWNHEPEDEGGLTTRRISLTRTKERLGGGPLSVHRQLDWSFLSDNWILSP